MTGTGDGTYLGVHVGAGTAFLALVSASGSVADGVDVRALAFPAHADDRTRPSRDYLALARQMLRGCRPSKIALLNTRKYSGWAYNEAVSRVSVETCLMIAAAEEEVGLVVVTQEHAAKMLGLEANRFKTAGLTTAVAGRVDPAPSAWAGKRSLAYVAAVVARADDEGRDTA